MPWRIDSPMSLRLEFVQACARRGAPITALCERYGISEKTGHKWLRRFVQEGAAGLADRSHVPHRYPHAVSAGQVAAILRVRRQHPTWGARKVRRWLEDARPSQAWPAASTVGAVLDRHGLIVHRRRRRGQLWQSRTRELTPATAPNEVWTADFKGQFRLRTGPYCYPLTVADAYSRYLLGCTAVPQCTVAVTRARFEGLFHTYGLPRVLRTDNGLPFAHPNSLGRLSTLAVWWIKLGIRPEHIDPSSPWQNGRHERFHRTLKADATRPASPTFPAQQRRFDRFRLIYNTERPHEALNQDPPARHYTPSLRPYTRPQSFEYPAHLDVRRVSLDGDFKWRASSFYLTQALRHELVALEETAEDHWSVFFGPLQLGVIHDSPWRFTPELVWHDNQP